MISPFSRISPLMLMLSLFTTSNVSVGSAFFVVGPAPSSFTRRRPNVFSPSPHRRMQQTNGILRQPTASSGGLTGATDGAPEKAATAAGRTGRRLFAGGNVSSSDSSSSNGNSSSSNTSGNDDYIDLDMAIANARADLSEGRSPGAGLESAFDQADAAFADLIVTSVDDQGVTLDDQDVEELAKGGMMDDESTSKKSRGLFGDMSDVFGALSGGAHIVRRENGSL